MNGALWVVYGLVLAGIGGFVIGGFWGFVIGAMGAVAFVQGIMDSRA